MTPLDTGEIIPSVFAVKDGYVNLFLIKGSTGYIAVDTGKDKKIVSRELKQLKINPDDVKAVFLTHSDFDHTGAVDIFSKARIFLAQPEERLVTGKIRRFRIKKNSLNCRHELLQDGEEPVIDGLRIKCILTPGHTPGSMCFLVDGKYLFCGDSMSLKAGKVHVFNNIFNMDSELQKKSLKKLAGLSGPEMLVTAHYGCTEDVSNAFSGLN